MDVVDGKKIASEILEKLKSLPKPEKFLAAVLVGDDPSSASFLKQKEETAKELGVDFRLYKFPNEIKNDELREGVGKISAHKTCGGVIVQLPLEEHLNRYYILNAVPRDKDVDVLSERAVGAFYAGRNVILPPSVGVVGVVCQASGIKYQDLRVAVVGRGLLVGKPISLWLMDKVRELIVLGHNADFSVLNDVDLVISGVGKAGIIKPDMLKSEAGVIDFGYDKVDGKICGDFDDKQLKPNTHNLTPSFYTPTPGGTGPILVAKLFENFYKLNEKTAQKD